jgi:hypothetical protein
MQSKPKKTILQRLGFGKSRASKKETGQPQSQTLTVEPPPSTQQPQPGPSSTTNESVDSVLRPNASNTSTPAHQTIRKGTNFGLLELYTPPSGLSPVVDIVFLHGLTGKAYDTWYHKAANIHRRVNKVWKVSQAL